MSSTFFLQFFNCFRLWFVFKSNLRWNTNITRKSHEIQFKLHLIDFLYFCYIFFPVVAMIVFAVALAFSILIGITACYVLRDQSSRSR